MQGLHSAYKQSIMPETRSICITGKKSVIANIGKKAAALARYNMYYCLQSSTECDVSEGQHALFFIEKLMKLVSTSTW